MNNLQVVTNEVEIPEWLDFVCKHVMLEEEDADPRIFKDQKGRYGRVCIKCAGD